MLKHFTKDYKGVIAKKDRNNIVLSRDISSNGAKEYAVFELDDFVKKYESSKIKTKEFYEVIASDHYEYYDIDIYDTELSPDKVWKQFRDAREKIEEGEKFKWRLTDSSRKKEGTKMWDKVSIHAVNRNKVFNQGSQKIFIDKNRLPLCDMSVYTPNRNMRLLYSSKYEQNRPLLQASWHKASKDKKDIREFLISVPDPKKTPVRLEKLKIERKENKTDLTDVEIKKQYEMCQFLVNMIDNNRMDNRDGWIRLGWCLYNIGKGSDDYMIMWIDKAEQTSRIGYHDQDACEDTWEKMVDTGKYTIGTLMAWAKEDNPDKYDEYFGKEEEPKRLLPKKEIKVVNRYEKYRGDVDENNDEGWSDIFAEERKDDIVVTNINGDGYVYDEKKLVWESRPALYIMNQISPTLLPIVRYFMDIANKRDENKKAAKLAGIKTIIGNTSKSQHIYKKVITKLLNMQFKKIIDCKQIYMFPTKGGKVVDLKTGESRDRTKEDMFSFETKIEYKKFEDKDLKQVDEFFLSLANGKEELKLYLQRLLGYCLSGDISHRKFYLFIGKGRNGKSTLYNDIISPIWNIMTKTAPKATFIGKDKGNLNTPELLELIGLRLSIVSECENGDELKDDRIKNFTGGDEIKGKALYENEMFSFMPTVKIIFLTNEVMTYKTHQQAMIDRAEHVPFSNRFENTKENLAKVQYIKENLDKVLYWLVQGAIGYFKDGMPASEDVKKETKTHIEESDSVLQFIKDRLLVNPNGKVRKAEMQKAYKDYCEERLIKKKENPPKVSKGVSDIYPIKKDGKGIEHYTGCTIIKEEIEIPDIERLLTKSLRSKE
jgi:P4 family phage/plasmid primase-like protien